MCRAHLHPAQAVCIKDLPLAADAAKLQLAYALWAEGLAAVVPSSGGSGAQQQQQQPKKKQKQHKQGGGGGQQQAGGKKQQKRGAPADGADGEETATSSGKARPAKKAKA